MKCKITDKIIKPFMSFGKMPIANGFIKKENFENEFYFNMEVGFSEELSLFQLNEHPKPEAMFNEKYPFFSSSSELMKIHFKEYANYVVKKILKPGSKLIEIGSNDGTLLKNFLDHGVECLGYEPSKNVADTAMSNGIKTINSFFAEKNLHLAEEYVGKTEVICASNVICHIPNLNDLIMSLDKMLSKNGVFIFEEPYLGSMFEKISYDQIYDEHIYIFSASSVEKIFKLYDFELVDALPQTTHGGSMRYVVKRKNKDKKSNNLIKILEKEKIEKLDSLESCIKFKKNCELSKLQLINKINKLKNENKSICGYAATSKSTTILNYCNIGSETIQFICDTTPEKIGKFSPGMHIPIVDMNHFRKNITDAVYLFAWNHKEEILKKESKYKIDWFSHVAL
jgi:methylation protein EvaC